MKWISLSKEFPESCRLVLIYLKYTNAEDGTERGATHLAFWDDPEVHGEIMWMFCPCECKEKEYGEYEVTHWAPLPIHRYGERL